MQIVIPDMELTRGIDEGKRVFNGRLGRVGEWTFEKLSDPTDFTTCKRSVITINVPSIVAAIQKCKRACDMIWHKELEFIVIGPDQFDDLQDEYMKFPPFTASVPIHIGFNNEKMRVFGVPVKFVPWATGLLCVPK